MVKDKGGKEQEREEVESERPVRAWNGMTGSIESSDQVLVDRCRGEKAR